MGSVNMLPVEKRDQKLTLRLQSLNYIILFGKMCKARTNRYRLLLTHACESNRNFEHAYIQVIVTVNTFRYLPC